MMRARRGTVMGLAALLWLAAAGVSAQSLTSLRGLGYPLLPTDARAQALGGLGIGLFGLAASTTDPTAAVAVRRRGVVTSALATERTTALGDVSANTGTTRFPVTQILVPVGRVVLSGGYSAFLDQSWAVSRDGSQALSTGIVGYRDVVESVGGVGQATFGAAVPVGGRVAVGVSVGTYSGSQRLTITRQFDSTAIGSLQPYRERRTSEYGGVLAQAGFRWDPLDALRVAGSVTWSGTLAADSVSGPSPSREYEMPLRVAGGASAYLAPGVMAAVSGRWSGWSATDPSEGLAVPAVEVTARDTWELGAGVEFDNPERRATRAFPVRLGFQYRQLPFTFVSDAPTEWLASAGLGLRIGPDFNTPLARVDLTIQRGARTAAGDDTTPALNETLWRFALAIAVFGT